MAEENGGGRKWGRMKEEEIEKEGLKARQWDSEWAVDFREGYLFLAWVRIGGQMKFSV